MTRIVIVGEAWGAQEAEAKRPFIGASGALLNRLLEESGIFAPGSSRRINAALWDKKFWVRDQHFADHDIHLTNVFNLQPIGNRIEALCGPRWGSLPPIKIGKYLREEYVDELERLKLELRSHKPNLIVGLGATALWFLKGTSSITRNRGTVSLSPYGKCLSTFHPAYILRGATHERAEVVLDLAKAKREAAFAEVRRPQRFVYVPETIDDIDFIEQECAASDLMSIDIETVGDQITCIGFAWSKEACGVIPIFDRTKPDLSYWNGNEEPIVWARIRRLCGMPVPKVFQNGLYDLHFLWRSYGITTANAAHDTMLLHHALQPELPKGLGYLGSIYTDEPAWKLDRPRGKGTVKREDE